MEVEEEEKKKKKSKKEKKSFFSCLLLFRCVFLHTFSLRCVFSSLRSSFLSFSLSPFGNLSIESLFVPYGNLTLPTRRKQRENKEKKREEKSRGGKEGDQSFF